MNLDAQLIIELFANNCSSEVCWDSRCLRSEFTGSHVQLSLMYCFLDDKDAGHKAKAAL